MVKDERRCLTMRRLPFSITFLPGVRSRHEFLEFRSWNFVQRNLGRILHCVCTSTKGSWVPGNGPIRLSPVNTRASHRCCRCLLCKTMFQAINNMDRDSSYAPSSTSYQSSSITDRGPSEAMDPSQATSATVRGDPTKRAVQTDKAPAPLPFFSQAIICQGMVYCSGTIGMSPSTKQMVDGGVGDRTVGPSHPPPASFYTNHRLTT